MLLILAHLNDTFFFRSAKLTLMKIGNIDIEAI